MDVKKNFELFGANIRPRRAWAIATILSARP